MGKKKINKNARTISLKANSKKEFLLFHGYTGSPTDFNDLAKYLHQRFNANVKILRFIGHGTDPLDLKGLKYKDFFLQARKEIKKSIQEKKKVVVGGISLGSLIASEIASEFPVEGIIVISVPLQERGLMKLISFFEPLIPKKFWKKPFSEEETKMREKAFFYPTSIHGLKIINQGRKQIKDKLKKINSPIIVLHVKEDKVYSPEGGRDFIARTNSKIKKFVLLNQEERINHNPFYSKKHKEINRVLGKFIEEKIFKPK